jgi:hypothetical protein
MSRLFSSPGSSRETILFGGPDPNQSCIHESANGTTPMMSKEQPVFPAFSSPSVSAKNPTPIRLHVGCPFFHVDTEI